RPRSRCRRPRDSSPSWRSTPTARCSGPRCLSALQSEPGLSLSGRPRRSYHRAMGVTERLARVSSRHPWRTVTAWVAAIIVALGLAAVFLPGNLTTNGHVTGHPQSERAESLFYRSFPPDPNTFDELVVVR